MTSELRRLLDLEASRSDPPAALREKVRVGLASDLRRPFRRGRRLSFGSGRLWALLGAGALAAAAWRLARRPSSAHPTPAPVVISAPATDVPALVPVTADQPAAPEAPAPPRKESHLKAARSGPAAELPLDSLTRERELIERARAHLRASRPGAALGALREHERAFPDGILLEERLGLQIQALAATGELETAGRRAREFRIRFPQSPLLPAIDAALRSPR
jgi:hypothetical protein